MCSIPDQNPKAIQYMGNNKINIIQKLDNKLTLEKSQDPKQVGKNYINFNIFGVEPQLSNTM